MSESEARQRLEDLDDVALILLDVVMEDDHSGLRLVEHIREELHNRDVRIVLRTGQPGQAPEHEVVDRYDINDYKEKTELTAQKLSTAVYAALRAWRDLQALRASERGLEQVIHASTTMLEQEVSSGLQKITLEQLGQLLGPHRAGFVTDDLTRTAPVPQPAGETSQTQPPISKELQSAIDRVRSSGEHQFGNNHYVLNFGRSHAGGPLMFVGHDVPLSALDANLLRLFATNVTAMLHSMDLANDLSEAQMEMVYLLAGATESRSHETAAHVYRVGLLAELLARALGLDEKQCELLRLAAPLHDVGKIGIPDAILNKAGPHTPEETTIMRTHAEIGHHMLATSKRPILQLAAEIALSHHERWDGGGYPTGLKGTDIPVSGRITMLADVFDALGSRRCYKEAWAEERVLEFIQTQRGAMFEPVLVDLLLQNLDHARAIREQYPD
ncbi:MAG TPA: HD domain-containing phosphohydrolase [Chiayiivirga sp.]|nr:HD domain-containing phosphohydrolase [Chiayiivirga sp.]